MSASSKFLVYVSLVVLVLFSTPYLEAAGVGKTGEVFQFEASEWSGVYFDLKELYCTAFIPGYLDAGVREEDDGVYITGLVKDQIYYIGIPFNPGGIPSHWLFPTGKPPKSLEELIQTAHKTWSTIL